MTYANISAKQEPIVERLNDLLYEALAVAAAIRDNAQDDSDYLPLDVVLRFNNDYDTIISILHESADITI
jgi:hypothetical protein